MITEKQEMIIQNRQCGRTLINLMLVMKEAGVPANVGQSIIDAIVEGPPVDLTHPMNEDRH